MSGILVQIIMSCVLAKKSFLGPMNSIYFHYFLSGASHWYVRSDIKLPLYPYINMIDTHTQNTQAYMNTHVCIQYKQALTEWKLPSVYQPTPIFTLLPHHISVHTPRPLLHSSVEFLQAELWPCPPEDHQKCKRFS